jgi:serine/threonine protein kinase
MGMISGLRHLHSRGFAHCDLKPSNLLVSDDGCVRIADFGSVKMTDIGITAKSAAVITPLYAAPELYGEDAPTIKVDVWGFGLILYEILCGETVFPLDASILQMDRMVGDPGARPNPDEARCPWHLRIVIEKCWAVKPEDRPDFRQLEDTFKRINFKFFPDVDSDEVAKYLAGLGK